MNIMDNLSQRSVCVSTGSDGRGLTSAMCWVTVNEEGAFLFMDYGAYGQFSDTGAGLQTLFRKEGS